MSEDAELPVLPPILNAGGGGWRRRWQPEWLTRDMQYLIAARTSMSAARAMAGILVPIYLALIGFNAVTLGLLFTVVALVSALLSMSVGLLADRIGRKPFLIILPLFAALAAMMFAFSRVGAVIFVFAALGSFGRGAGAGAGMVGPYQPAEQALLADAVADRYRNNLFARIGFASTLGALLGGPLAALPSLVGSLGLRNLAGLNSYAPAFIVTAGLAALAAAFALPVREPRRARAGTGRRTAPPVRLSRATWSFVYRLWITNGVNGLAIGFFGPFITYWFYRRYQVGPAEVGLLYTVINIAAIASNLGAAGLARRLGLVRAIVWSRALQAILIVPMVLAPTFWLAGAVYLLRMLAQRVGLPLRQSYVMGIVAPAERGRAGALSNLAAQGTSAISPTFAGFLFDHVTLALPFEIGAFFQGLNTLLFYVFFRHLPPPEERAAAPTDADAAQPLRAAAE